MIPENRRVVEAWIAEQRRALCPSGRAMPKQIEADADLLLLLRTYHDSFCLIEIDEARDESVPLAFRGIPIVVVQAVQHGA